MRQLNEKHTWFNLDKNDGCILRYTTKDGSMLDLKCIEKLENNTNKVVLHKYGFIMFKRPLKKIIKESFYNNKHLETLVIPNSVTTIGISAFALCYYLRNIILPSSLTNIYSCAFQLCRGLKTITIPYGTTLLSMSAFKTCSELTSVTLPNTLEEIGRHTFIECSSLIEIKYEGTKELFNKITISKDYLDDFSWPSFEEGTLIICTDGILTLE